MSKSDFWILSVPSRGGSNADLCDDIERLLVSGSTSLISTVAPFDVPPFKVESLDVLISQSEQLTKQDAQCASAISKISDIIKNTVSSSSGDLKDYFMVQDKSPLEYVSSFAWNSSRFHMNKTISEISDRITSEIISFENDIRTRQTSFQQASSAFQNMQKKQSGNLSQKSLANIVHEEDVVHGSDYLTNVFIAVPLNLEKQFLNSYETLTDLVIPRSAKKLDQDSEFVLYTVVVFKKTADSFITKAREAKYTIREFTFEQGLRETEQSEFDDAAVKEKRMLSSLLRYASIAFSESFQGWIHLKCLCVYVESILRYGLPPDFSSVIFQPMAKSEVKIKNILLSKYAYLAQNPVGNNKVKNVDSSAGLDESMADLNLDEEYLPFVLFTVPSKVFNY
ncbi:V-type ATPase V1 subunit C [Schizosaccharomyces pombe]|uniref:V-type proton ATPase subunit C n=1 Tax=Schizosaccharomyces pombe (strain 972 / ATCC 24843) TaxID=284812 RepID=VATC_SCHPO|nr:putative V-type ATPase V1 subunit C [Schizosaccharomyces pombe]Q9HDW6.1 RecName: Full=V-type proton ATPase subunit C; Short=V-ATPase subunit C; AltName: Full=Vacuolar proton pump subunit C [Schizosaccharomyces pombe 972h-]CAC21471.1 V-type ATPase V1 subunit C (predicted) [Schizosaccharomyces pombe]|eukprot:NP_593891.1 putative V-type ATPase V1 subunit C [Schizosaccharomyces pombe]